MRHGGSEQREAAGRDSDFSASLSRQTRAVLWGVQKSQREADIFHGRNVDPSSHLQRTGRGGGNYQVGEVQRRKVVRGQDL